MNVTTRNLALFTTLFCSMGGCGSGAPRSGVPRAQVTVAVTYSGVPVTIGSVELNNDQTGEGGGSPLDKDGIAKIPNVPVGEYVVTVIPPPPSALPGEDTTFKKYENIPAEYHSPLKSPLRLKVSAEGGKTSYDLKTESVKKKD